GSAPPRLPALVRIWCEVPRLFDRALHATPEPTASEILVPIQLHATTASARNTGKQGTSARDKGSSSATWSIRRNSWPAPAQQGGERAFPPPRGFCPVRAQNRRTIRPCSRPPLGLRWPLAGAWLPFPSGRYQLCCLRSGAEPHPEVQGDIEAQG